MDPKAVEVQRARVPIRARESGSTLAAWRIEVGAPKGAIVLAEVGGRSWYRGEGALLGASQERLAEVWQSCLPAGESPPDMPQLG